MRHCDGFPHEIGLFLGYPPADVDGFIHRHDECRLVGAWKVYSDVDRARLTFDRFKRCTRICLDRWQRGVPLERFTVAA